MLKEGDPITEVEIGDAIGSAAREVFSMMLGLELEPGAIYIGKTAIDNHWGVVALLGFAGEWVGSGQLSCEPPFACSLATHMLGTEYAAVDNDVLDAMAEVANMIIGNVKNVLETKLGAMGLGIPTVVFGRNLETHSVGRPSWVIVPFTCTEGSLSVQITIARKRRYPQLHNAGGGTATAAVPTVAESLTL